MENLLSNEKLWGEVLFKAFSDYIDKNGWLTSSWVDVLEDNFSDWDEDYNDTNEKKTLFGIMYNLNFEESEDGKLIRPIEQSQVDTTPKRLFVVNEEINHKKYGIGKVKEVFKTTVIIQFNDKQQPFKFITSLFEQNII